MCCPRKSVFEFVLFAQLDRGRSSPRDYISQIKVIDPFEDEKNVSEEVVNM